MLAEDWEQIKLAFDGALRLPEEQRSAYLESACSDPHCRAVVAELLRNHAGAGRFMESVTLRIRHYVFASGQLVASRFRIVRLIGEGGMGEVYEAFDEKLQARVALKTLRPELVSDAQAVERFRREILVAREVSHENLCKIFDLVEHGEPDGAIVPCLTMQLLEGESLLKYLQARRPLSPAEALPLIRQIAGAIDALHAHGIVHRDLKPSNIMLIAQNAGFGAVVTDFGLAKPALQNENALFESQLDFRAGAPYFMAPELLREGRPGPASDVYALGLMMDEMVTDTRAFPAESLHGLFYQKLWEKPIPPTARSDRLDEKWDRVILRCLAADPAERYWRAGDAVAELESPPAAAPLPAPEVAPKRSGTPAGPSRHLRAWLWAFAVVLALSIGVARVWTAPGKSVVVFPIENLTNRPDLTYLCKGIAAELMRRLALIDGVQVIPYYEPRSTTRVGDLKGRYSLQGLLQVSGDRIRLTAQLTENRDGTLIWSQDFDREVQNPLQLQSDLAEGSVQALQVGTLFGRPAGTRFAGLQFPAQLLALIGFRPAALPRAATASSAAFDYYMRGQYLFEERTVPAALEAIQSYENALREDPGFALAEAALADAQFVLMDYDYAPKPVLVERARQYAEAAVRLGPRLAETYTSLAAVEQEEWRLAEAEQSYRTAIRLNPHSSRAHRWYAGLATQFGRYEDSLREIRTAVDLDPYDYSAQANLGTFLFYARRFQEAAEKLEQTLARKDLIAAHISLGDVYAQLGLESAGALSRIYLDRAIEQADLVEKAVRRASLQAPPASYTESIKYADRMHAEYYLMSGRPEAAQPYIGRLISDTEAGRIPPGDLAKVYAVAGDANQALPLLERAAAQKEHLLLFLKVSPQFDKVRQDPRFQALLQQIGI